MNEKPFLQKSLFREEVFKKAFQHHGTVLKNTQSLQNKISYILLFLLSILIGLWVVYYLKTLIF